VIAFLLGQPDIVEVNPKMKFFEGKQETLLHRVARSASPKTIELLVQAPGNDVDVKDTQGNTPLHIAVETFMKHPWDTHLSNIKVLLRHGANKDLPNNDGITPVQLAATSTHEELRKVFGI